MAVCGRNLAWCKDWIGITECAFQTEVFNLVWDISMCACG